MRKKLILDLDTGIRMTTPSYSSTVSGTPESIPSTSPACQEEVD